MKKIVSYLNFRRSFTRDGGRWGIGQVHRILTRTTYIGRHEFNKRGKTKELKPVGEVVVVDVPPIIEQPPSTPYRRIYVHGIGRSRQPASSAVPLC